MTNEDVNLDSFAGKELCIPPLEIKCKCTEATCLFMCKLCFNKDSQLCLGVGSYALAFYALWAGTPVAVKAFQKVKSGKNAKKREKKVLESFRRELIVLKSLRHPNIIGLYGYQVEGLYLVMEVARNGCLADKIRLNSSREFSNVVWPIHIKIALELVSGIRFLHKRGYIHGDLKSFNILLDSNYTVKIADFGTAGTETDKPENCPLSIAWASPSRLRGSPISMKSDVYAIGIILWELATLRLPYDKFNGSPQKLAAKILHLNLRPEILEHLDGLLSGYRIPTLFVWLMQKIWSADENERPQIGEIYTALIGVKTAWKCASCGWFNMKIDQLCVSCGFNPLSPSEITKAIAQKRDIEDIIQEEVENKDLEEILMTPKLSKPTPKSSLKAAPQTSTQIDSTTENLPSHATVDSLIKQTKPRLETKDYVADIDLNKFVKTDSSMYSTSAIIQEHISDTGSKPVNSEPAYTTKESETKSVTFEDEVWQGLFGEQVDDTEKFGQYTPLKKEVPSIPTNLPKPAKNAKLYEKRFKKIKAKAASEKRQGEKVKQKILLSTPLKKPGVCKLGRDQVPSQPNEKIYSSLDTRNVKHESIGSIEGLTSEEVTIRNTLNNQAIDGVVTFVNPPGTSKSSFDYSKYNKSCIVKDCGKCSFKDACVLNVHKNMHNLDPVSGRNSNPIDKIKEDATLTLGFDNINKIKGVDTFYKSHSSHSSDVEGETIPSVWSCDLCGCQNNDSDTECVQCLAMRY